MVRQISDQLRIISSFPRTKEKLLFNFVMASAFMIGHKFQEFAHRPHVISAVT
jgi:hypothetical protein